MYQSIYRKYRPRRFSEVVGQDLIVTALKNQVAGGRTGHAYLFSGTRGTGKTSCAKIFAKAVNCLDPQQGEPCGKCQNCLAADAGAMVDILEMDAATNTGIDNIRDLQEEFAYVPTMGKYKVYIIDEAHMLSLASFNALLKSIEEPPEHLIFILATTEVHKLPATVLSRCQRFDFKHVDADTIAKNLLDISKAEGIALTEGAANLIARLGAGSVRDAQSLLDTCAAAGGSVDEQRVRNTAGIADKSKLFQISAALGAGNGEAALSAAGEMLDSSFEVKRLSEELFLHFRNLLVAGYPASEAKSLLTAAESFEQYHEAAKAFSGDFLLKAMETMAEGIGRLSRSAQPRMELELSLLRIARQAGEPQTKTAAVPISTAPSAQSSKAVKSTPQKEEPKQLQASFSGQQTPSVPEKPEKAESAEPTPTTGVEIRPFGPWKEVLQQLKGKDGLIYASLSGTKAYFDGRRVLIDGPTIFMEFMREKPECAAAIKEAIEAATGERYAIGPYKKEGRVSAEVASQPEPSAANPMPIGLQALEQAGIPIERIDSDTP